MLSQKASPLVDLIDIKVPGVEPNPPSGIVANIYTYNGKDRRETFRNNKTAKKHAILYTESAGFFFCEHVSQYIFYTISII